MPLIEILYSDIPLIGADLEDETVQAELTSSIEATKRYFLGLINYTEDGTDLRDEDGEKVIASNVAMIRGAIIDEIEAKYYVRARPDVRPNYVYFFTFSAYYCHLKFKTIGLRF